eukprot:365910-Chlamydomonas_euryale.AAC.39
MPSLASHPFPPSPSPLPAAALVRSRRTRRQDAAHAQPTEPHVPARAQSARGAPPCLLRAPCQRAHGWATPHGRGWCGVMWDGVAGSRSGLCAGTGGGSGTVWQEWHGVAGVGRCGRSGTVWLGVLAVGVAAASVRVRIKASFRSTRENQSQLCSTRESKPAFAVRVKMKASFAVCVNQSQLLQCA